MAAFPVSVVPTTETIFAHMQRMTSYDAACAISPRLRDTRKIEMELVGAAAADLKQSVLEIIEQYGFSGWRHQDGESKTYGGFSLTYNPDHQDSLDPHISSIGTPKNASSEFYWASVQRHAELKHSYFDTYGFRVRTPASKVGALGTLIDGFKRPLVRSRVGIICGENVDPNNKQYKEKEGWHRDEPVFENLRINIPLQTDENYLFQMEDETPYHLEVGKAYSWDTHRPHRVFAAAPTKTMRIHLVLGVSPWFDFDPAEDSWRPNEFFGKVHPFDMLAEGLISQNLRVIQRN